MNKNKPIKHIYENQLLTDKDFERHGFQKTRESLGTVEFQKHFPSLYYRFVYHKEINLLTYSTFSWTSKKHRKIYEIGVPKNISYKENPEFVDNWCKEFCPSIYTGFSLYIFKKNHLDDLLKMDPSFQIRSYGKLNYFIDSDTSSYRVNIPFQKQKVKIHPNKSKIYVKSLKNK